MDGPPNRILFIAPPFGKGSGGHWDIMRLIAALQAGEGLMSSLGSTLRTGEWISPSSAS